MPFFYKSSLCLYKVLNWIALLSLLFCPSSAEYLEPIYFVDGDIYSTSILRAPIDKFGPQNAFRRQLSINEADDFAGSWVSGFFQQCDPNWTASNHISTRPKNCTIYIKKEYCTKEGTLGSKWTWGDIENYKNLESGLTAFACPQCGCKQESAKVWIDFQNSGEIVAKFSFRNRREEGSNENNPLEFRLFGADKCSVLGNETHCDSNWIAKDNKPDDPKNCTIYADKQLCTKNGGYGAGWKFDELGNFGNFADQEGRTAQVCPQCGCNEESFKRIGKKPEFVNKVIIQSYRVSSDKWSGNDMEMTFPVDPDNRQTKRCVGIEIYKISGGKRVAIQNIKMWTQKRSDGERRLVKKTQMLEMGCEAIDGRLKMNSDSTTNAIKSLYTSLKNLNASLENLNATLKDQNASLKNVNATLKQASGYHCELGRTKWEDEQSGDKSEQFKHPFKDTPKCTAGIAYFLQAASTRYWHGLQSITITKDKITMRRYHDWEKFWATWICCGN